jgi:hypothetical protein
MSVEEQASAPPGFNSEESGDAIHISVDAHDTDNMRFIANVDSWSPVRMQADVDGPELDVVEVTAPAGDTPGVYQAAITYTVIGPHTIHAWNNTCTCDAEVFAGDIPAWNPDKYQKTASQIAAIEVQKAARIGGTTGVLNG